MMKRISNQALAGSLTFLLGAVVVAGWILHVPWMVQTRPNFAGMPLNAALSFMLVGIALLAPSFNIRRPVLLQQAIGVLLIALASLVFIETVFNVDLLIDFSTFQEWLGDKPWPGRMAPNTCIGFILAGVVLLLAPGVHNRATGFTVQIATFALLMVGLTGVIGYSLKLEMFYAWFHAGRMAIHTAVGMVLVAFGLWQSWCDAEWNQRRGHLFKDDERISLVGGAILIAVTFTTGLAGFVAYQGNFDRALRDSLWLSLQHRVITFQLLVDQSIVSTQSSAQRQNLANQVHRLDVSQQDTQAFNSLKEIGENIFNLGFSGVTISDRGGRELLRLGRIAQNEEIAVDAGARIPSSLIWAESTLLLKTRVDIVYNGVPAGFLITEKPLPFLGDAFSSAYSFGETGEIRLCAAQGEQLNCFPQRFKAQVEITSRYSPQGKLLPVSYAVNGQSGIVEAADYRGHNVVAAYAPLNAHGLGMVVKQDTEEFYAPLRDQFQRLMPLLLVFIVSGVLLLRSQLKPIMSKVLSSEQELAGEKEQLRVTLESIGDAVITTDIAGHVTYLNPVAEAMTGWPNAEARGLTLTDIFQIFNEETREPVRNPVELVLQGEKRARLANHTVLRRRDGTECAIEDAATPIRGSDHEIVGIVLVFHDVTTSRRMTAEISHQATHDALTDLLNRREFERRLDLALQSAKADGKRHSLLYLDLDQFKVVNDTCGHVAGDELLRQLASIFVSHTRQNDALARLGGDEFGLLLNSCPPEVGMQIAQSLHRAVCDFRFAWQDKVFPICVSIGLVHFGHDDESLAEVLSAADAACYIAKEKGRNRIHVYFAEDSDLVKRHGEMNWISRIQTALDEKRFLLYKQKTVPLGSPENGEHHEVLIRMRDEHGSMVPPMAFIPAAERYNLMPTLDRWIIRTAFAQFTEAGARGETIRMRAINLSGASISDPHLFSFIRDQFEEFQVPPHAICFEVTETSAIANLSQAAVLIRELKMLGCRFALDDFGSGMSSFAYLKHLPVDYLKIDGSFVKDMVKDPIDHAMVEAINYIGHVMGIQTIAEFVEDRKTLEELKKIGVDFAQGFGIEQPVPI